MGEVSRPGGEVGQYVCPLPGICIGSEGSLLAAVSQHTMSLAESDNTIMLVVALIAFSLKLSSTRNPWPEHGSCADHARVLLGSNNSQNSIFQTSNFYISQFGNIIDFLDCEILEQIRY